MPMPGGSDSSIPSRAVPGPGSGSGASAERFNARDGAALSGGQTVTITAIEDAEIVLVDAD